MTTVESAKTFTVVSGAKEEKVSILWKIENFDTVRRNEKLLTSQRFTFHAGETIGVPHKWAVSLTVETEEHRGYNKNSNQKWVGVYHQRVKSKVGPVTDVYMRNDVIIKNAKGGIFFSSSNDLSVDDMSDGRSWGFDILKIDEQTEKLPLVNGCLVIEMTFTIICPLASSIVYSMRSSEERAFTKDYLSLLKSDIKLISKDHKEFNGHKSILAARSPVFQDLFQSNVKDENVSVIQLDDLSSKVVEILLHYIYSGSLPDEWHTADVTIADICYAAGKYGITADLREHVLDKLKASSCDQEELTCLQNLSLNLVFQNFSDALLQIKNDCGSILA